MNISNQSLDLELLRCFVAVVDGGGFTQAAKRLHKTQSTISQQLKRLEERLDTPLLSRSTRRLALTERGELLLGYARRMLALQDQAIAALTETRLKGRVRLGAAQEVADGGLADLLAHFSALHPGVHLEIRVDANTTLGDLVKSNELDLAVLFQEPGQNLQAGSRAEVIARLRRVWVTSPKLEIRRQEPIPLVLSNSPCIFRNSVLNALDSAARPWRIVLSTPSLSGMRAAIRAGLGIGVRTERWLEDDLSVIETELPELPDVELALVTADGADELLVERLRSALMEALREG